MSIYGTYLTESYDHIDYLYESIINECNEFDKLINIEEMKRVPMDSTEAKIRNAISKLIKKIISFIGDIIEKIKRKILSSKKLIMVTKDDFTKKDFEDFKESSSIVNESKLNDLFSQDKIESVIIGNITFDLARLLYQIKGDEIKDGGSYIKIEDFYKKYFKKESFSIIEFINTYGNTDLWVKKLEDILKALDRRKKELENVYRTIETSKDDKFFDIVRRAFNLVDIEVENNDKTKLMSLVRSTISTYAGLINMVDKTINNYYSNIGIVKRKMLSYIGDNCDKTEYYKIGEEIGPDAISLKDAYRIAKKYC